MSTGHRHRGDGALVDHGATRDHDEPARAAAPALANGFVAAWARAVRARRAAPREPKQFTDAGALADPPVDDHRAALAAAPPPPAAVSRGTGSRWLRR